MSIKDMEVVVLADDDARSWALWPHAAKRVHDFCTKYDSDADPALLVAQLKLEFVKPNPAAFMMLLIAEQKVVGHLLVSLDHWFGTRFVTIIQMEADLPVSRTLQVRSLEFVENWARSNGCKFVQCMAKDETASRAFSIFHGFKKQRVMMRKTLAVSGESPSTGVVPSAESA